MQNLIDRISKIEEATARIHAQAEEEKKKIDKEMQAETDAYNARMEAETERKLEQTRGDYRKKAEADLKKQRELEQQVLTHISSYYEKEHDRLSSEIAERIIRS